MKYQQLEKSCHSEDCQDSRESLIPNQRGSYSRWDNPPRQPWRLWILTVINIALFLLTISVAGLGYKFRISLENNSKNALIRMTDAYSPVHDQVQIDFVDITINGSLLDMHNSIYRSPPSPEVDAAWERIGSLMPHVISTEDVIKLGKDPSKTARFPEEWGFGPDAHVAEMDVLHTIHCLNAIRRDIHWRYYFKDIYPDGNFSELHRVHTDHCIHIVLQNLMCSATADIITQPWVEGQLHPFPDFNVEKKCRNFDAILDWHEKTMVKDMSKFVEIAKPAELTPYRMSLEFHRMFDTGVEEALHGVHDHGGHGIGHAGHS